MKPRTLGVVVTGMGARSDFASHVPVESAGRFNRSSWTSPTSRGLRSVSSRDFLVAAARSPEGRPSPRPRCVRRQPHAAKRNSTIAQWRASWTAPIDFAGSSDDLVRRPRDNMVPGRVTRGTPPADFCSPFSQTFQACVRLLKRWIRR